MTAVCTPYRSNARRVAGSRQPIVDSGPDPATFQGWIALSFMPGDQQHDTLATCYGPLQCPVDRQPGAIQAMAVEIEHAIRVDPSGAQAVVPASVERGGLKILNPLRINLRPDRPGEPGRRWRWRCGRCRRRRRIPIDRIAGQRPDGCRNPGPKFSFFRGQAAHGSQRPWEGG